MFNLSGTELVFLVVIALVVLGPEKLPEAVRKFAKTYGELKKMSTGFQSELRSALDEPMKEMRATADALRDAVNVDAVTEQVTSTAATSTPATSTPATSTPATSSPATAPPPNGSGGNGASTTAATPPPVGAGGDDAGERPTA